MKNSPILRQFEFRIPSSVYAITGSKQHQLIQEHLPLLKANIDFELGEITVESDWNYVMTSSGHTQAQWHKSHGERMLLKIGFTPAPPINIEDDSCFDWIWPIQGCMYDGKSISECNGIMILDRSRKRQPTECSQWNISIYIYNSLLDTTEIKLKLPLYVASDKVGCN